MSEQDTQSGQNASSAAVVAAAMSVLYSWYVFFLEGNRQRGIFIGLWPPTIIAFASYIEQTDMMQNIQEES